VSAPEIKLSIVAMIMPFFKIPNNLPPKYNLIRGEIFIGGECVAIIEDTGFSNVDQMINLLLSALPDETPRPIKVQAKITNLDKQQTRLYQRVLQ